jgi:AcrR family transcriptional regulator
MRDPSSTRERIDRAALGLFVEKGVAETSIRDIAQRAGIADGALYRHYRSKDELVWQLFSSRYLAFAETLDGLQLGQPTAKRKLDAMVRGFCAFFDRDWELFAFLLIVQHGQLAKLPDGTRTPVDVVRDVVAAAMERQEIPPRDPDLATAMIIGAVLQVATFHIYRRLKAPLGDHAGEIAAACWRLLAGNAKAGLLSSSIRSRTP